MGGYANRELVRDNVTGIWWEFSALFSVCGFVLAAVDGYSWLVLALGSGFGAWRIAHAGVWVGQDDILIVHPLWGRRRIRWTDIERSALLPLHQWMIAWVITFTSEKIPCQGISSRRRRTQRVDVVVEQLNAILKSRSAGAQNANSDQPAGSHLHEA